MPTAIDFVPDEEVAAQPTIDFQPDPEPVERPPATASLRADRPDIMPDMQATTRGGPHKPLASAAETLASFGNEAGDVAQSLNEPIGHLPKPLTDQEENIIRTQGTKGENVAIGTTKAIEDSLNWFTSPIGISTLGIGGLPRAGQRIIAGIFATQMASQTPAIAKELGTELAKPESERDYQKVSELVTSAALTTGFTAMAGKHALAPGPKVSPVFQGPQATGAILETPKGAPVPAAEALEPPQAVSPEDSDAAARLMQRTATATYEPPKPAKPTVPETPAEDQTPILGEIRKANARTKKDIQRLFPQRQLTNEEAAALRDQAWPDEAADRKAQALNQPAAETTVEEPPPETQPDAQPPPPPAKPATVAAPVEDAAPAISVTPPVTPKSKSGAKPQDRPPDLIDKLQGHFPNGIRVTSKSDYGGLVDEKTGAARGFLFKGKGEPADIAQREAEAQGFGRWENEDQFIQAILDAGAQRIGVREQAARESKVMDADAQQAEDFGKAAFRKRKDNAPFSVEKLNPGDKFKLKGETFTVKSVDEYGNVTVEPGTVFGRQTMQDGETFHPDGGEVIGSDGRPVEPPAPVPKLRPGEKSGDLFQSEDAPFNLSGEKGTDAERIAAEKAKAEQTAAEAKAISEKQQGQLPGTEPLAFGGARPKAKAVPTPTPVATTPAAVVALKRTFTPGLNLLSKLKQGVQSLLLPSAKSPQHLTQAEILGSKLGPMNQRAEASAAKLRPHERMFDRLGVNREGVAPAANPGIKFMSDMSQGTPLTVKFKAVGDLIQKLFQERLQALELAGAPLQTVRENYFPGMWTSESRLAFNAAMEEAVQAGVIGKNFDVNNATPQQKAWVKQRVDANLEQGKGSDKDALAYLTRSPMKGRESFRKQKVFGDIMDAAEFGLRPITANPVELVKLKLAEMDKSIMANQYFQTLKGRGELKIISPYEEVPEGWVKVNDKYGTIYGKPTVTIPEHVDKAVYEGLLEAANKLGIKHERSMQFPPGPGNRALGLSYQGQNLVRTKFATETSVLAHEIGHQIDHKYDLWREMTGGEKGNERKSQVQKELRAIADMTGRSAANTRTKVEKIAQMMEAYVHAPDRMMKEAPYLFNKFENFLKSKPELEGITKIQPGIELTRLTGEKYVGLPIMGYRIVPEAAGDIINNYLSSSLYNNRYFGTMYRGWMGMANALNQSQLGIGSAFHAGFTTGEAQVSAGANVIKDMFGVARGNRSVSDLRKSISNAATASIRTAIVGDRVLNAWRDSGGTVDPKIAQVVKAAELGGGGFKLEPGLRTDQSSKAYQDWFSGHKTRAVMRSPVALVEQMARPIMDWLVPRQKAGVFAELANRIIEQNPGKPLEDLSPQFRQAWNRVDARLGQVRYNRLFANNTAKNLVQGLVRAPGWTGGTIAELGGAFTDAGGFLSEWVKTGKMPENIPDRTAYAMSLLLTIGAANAALTYAFTGTAPTGMDYFAFRTGKKDEKGRDERFLLPSYMKDILAYSKAPLGALANKTHPILSMLNEVLVKNQDYYGVEIRSPGASVGKQAGQVGKYVVKSFEPFWTRGVRKEVGRDVGIARTVAPFFGVMPAPPSINNTAAENLAAQLLRQQMPQGSKTQEQFEQAQRVKDAASQIKRGAMTPAQARQQGIVNSRQQETALKKRATLPYLEFAVSHLSAKSAVDVYEKANADERKALYDEISKKIRHSNSLSKEDSAVLQKRFSELSK